MAISQTDLKKLWGLAAGRCSKPGCATECIRFLDAENPTVIGEMAHVIAKREDGPRGVPGGGGDSYDNLILLCPTHHTEIDRAPEGVFRVEALHGWKHQHEARVRDSLNGLEIFDLSSAIETVCTLLDENNQIWSRYGPESELAQSNPLSNAAELWNLRRISQIVPNNRRICNILDRFSERFSRCERKTLNAFKDHAAAFEQHCYNTSDFYPRFPVEFRTLMESR